MTTQTLSHLTLQTLDNYRTAANQAVVAYRLGSHRLVNVVNATLENSVYPRTAKLAPKATRRMNGVPRKSRRPHDSLPASTTASSLAACKPLCA